LHPIFLDIEADLAEVAREATLLEAAAARAAPLLAADADPIARYIHVSAVASGTERIYSGIEKALTRVARDIDGHVPSGADWHATLLRRLTLEVPDRRPAMLSAETYRLLDGLRAFRHRVRHSYTQDLNPPLVLDQAASVSPALRAVRDDIERLRTALDPA
jgi:hypothetical protein